MRRRRRQLMSWERRVARPPQDQPWTWHTRELLESPAWRRRSVNVTRLLDRLEIDHASHAGRENGALMATYDQLVAYGIPRSEIREAIDEAEFLGLARCERGGRWGGTNRPSRYRLTYYADRDLNPASNEWKGVTDEAIDAWRAARSQERKAQAAGRLARRQKRIGNSESRPTVVRKVALPPASIATWPTDGGRKS